MIDFRKEYSNGNLNAENFKKIEKLSSNIIQEHFKILDHYVKTKGLKYGGQYHYTLWTYLHGSNKNMINSSAILMELLVFKHLKFIDDEEAVRDMFKNVLPPETYEVETFPNCEGLLSYILSSPPDLLIMDLLLPWERGEDFIQRFKSIEKIRNLPIIVISGKTMSDTDIEYLKSQGIVNFFAKPFDVHNVLNEISRILTD